VSINCLSVNSIRAQRPVVLEVEVWERFVAGCELAGNGRYSDSEWLKCRRPSVIVAFESDQLCWAMGCELHGVPEAQQREVELVHEVEVQGALFALRSELAEYREPNSVKWDSYAK
jgi:hypothetical protein